MVGRDGATVDNVPVAEVERVQPDDEPPFLAKPGRITGDQAAGSRAFLRRFAGTGQAVLLVVVTVAVFQAYRTRTTSHPEEPPAAQETPIPDRLESGPTGPPAPDHAELESPSGSRGPSMGPSTGAGTAPTTPPDSPTGPNEGPPRFPPDAETTSSIPGGEQNTGGRITSDGSTTTAASPAPDVAIAAPDPTITERRAPSTSPTSRPPATGSTTTTRRQTTTTSLASTASTPAPPPTPAPIVWALGPGQATSSPILPLGGAVTSGALPNYDTDRDDAAGLLLQKGGSPGETDPTKVQRWWRELPAGAHLTGRPELRLWAAMKDFDQAKTGRIDARLYDCAGPRTSCRQLASGSASVRQANFGTDFGQVTIAMPTIDWQATEGRGVVVELTVPSSSQDDLWLAFGTHAHNSRLAFT